MTTILITGANRGIGFHLAQEALDRGWRVYGSVRTAAQAEQAAAELGSGLHTTCLRRDRPRRHVSGDRFSRSPPSTS